MSLYYFDDELLGEVLFAVFMSTIFVVFSRQTDLPSGHTVVPLILASLWKCEADSTEITVNYK